jgi:UDP-glucose 4-epimerase
VAEVTGIEFSPAVGPRRTGDPASIVASGELAARDLDWAMRHTLPEMVGAQWEATRRAAQPSQAG